MEDRHENTPSPTDTSTQSPEVALDTVNMELKSRSEGPKLHRRMMEASIEFNARKRRSNAAPASSSYKKNG